VSVVVPFRGSAEDGEAMLCGLRSLELGEGDEVIVAENGGDGVAAVAVPGLVRLRRADGERSSYHARNTGAAGASNEWVLFMDADCAPRPDLLDAYFAAAVPLDCGALAGQILGDPRQRSLAARYARSRRLFDHAGGLIRAEEGGAGAGNLLVRRSAFVAIGGFARGIRSGGDLDLCRRLRGAGWGLGFRPEAVVYHRHRQSLASLLTAIARYGAGARWLNRRHPGSSPRWPLRGGLTVAAREAAAHLVRGDLESASFRAIDCLGLIAHNLGYLSPNTATGRRDRLPSGCS
jgi:GT2 family glycosyltransferase